jgi:hypothetical protein
MRVLDRDCRAENSFDSNQSGTGLLMFPWVFSVDLLSNSGGGDVST